MPENEAAGGKPRRLAGAAQTKNATKDKLGGTVTPTPHSPPENKIRRYNRNERRNSASNCNSNSTDENADGNRKLDEDPEG